MTIIQFKEIKISDTLKKTDIPNSWDIKSILPKAEREKFFRHNIPEFIDASNEFIIIQSNHKIAKYWVYNIFSQKLFPIMIKNYLPEFNRRFCFNSLYSEGDGHYCILQFEKYELKYRLAEDHCSFCTNTLINTNLKINAPGMAIPLRDKINLLLKKQGGKYADDFISQYSEHTQFQYNRENYLCIASPGLVYIIKINLNKNLELMNTIDIKAKVQRIQLADRPCQCILIVYKDKVVKYLPNQLVSKYTVFLDREPHSNLYL